jgi:methionyl aminopeptidase
MTSQLVEIKTDQELAIMDEAATACLSILADVHRTLRSGISTYDLDEYIGQLMAHYGVTSSFMGYTAGGDLPFQGRACLCVNNEVFHAPPSRTKILKPGDLLTVDLGVHHRGFHADCADTFLVESTDPVKQQLIDIAKEACHAMAAKCSPLYTTKDLTQAGSDVISKYGLFPTPNYGGHGLGREVHQPPFVANCMHQATACQLTPNMVLCLEPSVQQTPLAPSILEDKWTVALPNNYLSAHYERAVVITPTGGRILGQI